CPAGRTKAILFSPRQSWFHQTATCFGTGARQRWPGGSNDFLAFSHIRQTFLDMGRPFSPIKDSFRNIKIFMRLAPQDAAKPGLCAPAQALFASAQALFTSAQTLFTSAQALFASAHFLPCTNRIMRKIFNGTAQRFI